MRYNTMSEILDNSDTVQAITYLKELWYAVEEGFFSFSLDYKQFKQQFMHLKAYAPFQWELEWNGHQFLLSKQIVNHGYLSIIVQKDGQIIYTFS